MDAIFLLMAILVFEDANITLCFIHFFVFLVLANTNAVLPEDVLVILYNAEGFVHSYDRGKS